MQLAPFFYTIHSICDLFRRTSSGHIKDIEHIILNLGIQYLNVGMHMSVRKEDLHKLIEHLKASDRKTAYEFLRSLVDIVDYIDEENEIVEADNSPLCFEELKAIKKAEEEIANDELIDWEDLKNDV